MRKDHLFDQVARILASEMPRRQALRSIFGALVGATAAVVVGHGEARAATCTQDSDCDKKSVCCNGTCCGPNRTCCAGQCCDNAGWICCDDVCCPPGQCKNGRCGGNVSPS